MASLPPPPSPSATNRHQKGYEQSGSQLGGRQCFLLVNLVVVVVNAGLGILVNIAAFTTTHHPTKPLTPPLDHDNNSQATWAAGTVTGKVLPAAFGVSDASGNFSSHAFVWAGLDWAKVTAASEVCLVTHASVDRLHFVAEHARTWSGPVSVSVFAPGTQYSVAAAMVAYLRRCVPGVQERVSFHIVHPKVQPPNASLTSEVLNLSCDYPEGANAATVKLLSPSGVPKDQRYPQNLMRNLARRTCPTHFSLTIDVDMLVPPHTADHLSSFLGVAGEGPSAGQVCGRCAYVVPVYEVQQGITKQPQNKMELLRLLLQGQARRFHIKVYQKNQGNSHLENWEVEPPPNTLAPNAFSVLYNITTYEEFWEPILVLPFTAPNFDERFVGYGFTRSSQVYELHCRGFQFQVLDGAFLTHRGFQTTTNYRPSRFMQIEINRIRYQMFKRELHARLGLPPPSTLKGPPLPRRKLPVVERKPRIALRRVPALVMAPRN